MSGCGPNTITLKKECNKCPFLRMSPGYYTGSKLYSCYNEKVATKDVLSLIKGDFESVLDSENIAKKSCKFYRDDLESISSIKSVNFKDVYTKIFGEDGREPFLNILEKCSQPPKSMFTKQDLFKLASIRSNYKDSALIDKKLLNIIK